MDKTPYTQAVDRFLLEPAHLRADEIAVLTAADPVLGARAITRRDAAIAAAAARQRAALKRQGLDVEVIADVIADITALALVPMRQRQAALAQEQQTLTARVQALTAALQIHAAAAESPPAPLTVQ